MAIKAAMDDFLSDVKSLSFSSSVLGSNKQTDDNGKMKTKFLEAWNNFRYDFGSGTTVKKDSPLWILGSCYHVNHQPIDDSSVSNNKFTSFFSEDDISEHFKLFLLHFSSIPWFTYRKGFPSLPGCSLTSDTGWGCMLRTAQMMMAQCFIRHALGPKWRWLEKIHTMEECIKHRQIIKWFLDDPTSKCPFSIHRLTEIGLNYKYQPGDYYGPGTVAYIMQDATECAKGLHSLLNEVVVYVAQDCTVYKGDVLDIFNVDRGEETGVNECDTSAEPNTSTKGSESRSVIILIPVRLGEANLNPIYTPCLQAMLTLDHSMGIIGGRPKHSLYFVGFQDDYLFYLDPHYCQPADSSSTFANKHLEGYHNMSPRKTHISKMDPSCCLCFYCRDVNDFNTFVAETNKLLAPPKQRTSYPLCLIVEGRAREHKLRRSSEAQRCTVATADADSSFTEIHLSATPKPPADSSVPTEATGDTRTNDLASGSNCVEPSASDNKTDKFDFMSAPRALFANFRRQQSRSPKTHRKEEKSLEDEFELL